MAAEPHRPGALFGMAAEFASADALVAGVRAARAAGYRRIDAFTPFPIDGLDEALGFRERRIPRLMFAGGVLGAALGFGLQVHTNLDYPLNVGGRPLIAIESFAMIAFELMVLFAVLAGVLGMLVLNRLPRLHHPIFELERFHLASDDRFFLLLCARDPLFEPERTGAFMVSLGPARVDLVADPEPRS